LVMEFLEGQTVAELLATRSQLEVKEAVDILLPVVSAVSVGHAQGVVHRDLKPQNVFLARGGWGAPVPKVLDFGVSKMTGGDSAALTGTLAVLGTAAYMSPEQARGARQVDGQSDQYALGLVFYEMLTGSRAHSGDNPLEVLHNIANGAVTPPRQLRPELPEALVAVLMRMLEMAPTARYASLRDVGHALMPFAGDDTRIAMRDAFRTTDSEGPHRVRTTAIMPASGGPGSQGSAGGTQLLPESAARPSSTLGQAASQISQETENDVHPRNGRRVAIGIGIAAVIGVAVVVLGGHKPETPPPSQTVSTEQPSKQPRPTPAAVPPVVPAGEPQPTPAAHPTKPPPPTEEPAQASDDSRSHPSAAKGSAPALPKTREPPAASSHRDRHAKGNGSAKMPPAGQAPPKPNCNPNFLLDAQGEKHFKPECFLNLK
jgi:serine/threonine protein kinase